MIATMLILLCAAQALVIWWIELKRRLIRSMIAKIMELERRADYSHQQRLEDLRAILAEQKATTPEPPPAMVAQEDFDYLNDDEGTMLVMDPRPRARRPKQQRDQDAADAGGDGY